MLLLLFANAAKSAAAACASDPDCYGGSLATGKCLCPPHGPVRHANPPLKPAHTSTPGLLLPRTSTWVAARCRTRRGVAHVRRADEGELRPALVGPQQRDRPRDCSSPRRPVPGGGHGIAHIRARAGATLLRDGRVIIGELAVGTARSQLQGCINGTTPANVTVARQAIERATSKTQYFRPPGLSNCDWAHWKGVLVSTDAAGAPFSGKKWAVGELVGLRSAMVEAGPDSWHMGDANGSVVADNPSFWPLGNGSFLLAYATKLRHPEGRARPSSPATSTWARDREKMPALS